MESARTELRVLGPLELRSSGEAIHVGGPRQQKLFGLLLLNRERTLTLDELVDQLWEVPPASARQQVHNALNGLRLLMTAFSGAVDIERLGGGYLFKVRDAQVDLDLFRDYHRQAEQAGARTEPQQAIEHLRRALALWRGVPFQGLDSPALVNAAVKLTEQRWTAVETLMSLRLQVGDSATIVPELRGLVAEAPFREPLLEYLMIALYRSGRQADALAAYEHGRHLLLEQLGIDPGERLRRLHVAILNGDVDSADDVDRVDGRQAGTDPMATIAGTPQDRPCYLPNEISDFSGRDDELAALRLRADATDSSSAPVVVSAIDGMGGVGKTTLAVRLGHQIMSDYPDGQYFIDLRGFSHEAQPIQPEQALEVLLRSSGLPPESIAADLEGRQSQWRARTTRKRVLLILDNAADVAQVRPLIPGTSGIFVVVTSRRKLTALDGAVVLTIDILPQQDAIELFGKIVGTERVSNEADAVASVVELCGRLPLAIRIVAARMRDRQAWTVEHLAGRLRDEKQRIRLLAAGDRDVLSVLRLSYRYLDDDHQRLFRLLGLHPGPDFGVGVAGALVGIDADRAEEMLENLLDDNLLRQDVAGRYYFHDMIRACSQHFLDLFENTETQREALRRLYGFYRASIPDWIAEDGSAIDLEYTNIAAVIKSANRTGDHADVLETVSSLRSYLRGRNFDGYGEEILEYGLASVRALGDTQAESRYLLEMAVFQGLRGSTSTAWTYLNEAIELTSHTGDLAAASSQLIQVGVLHMEEGRREEAHEAFLHAKTAAAKVRDNRVMTSIINNLGITSRDLGRFGESLSYFDDALVRVRRDSDREGESRVLWSIGTVRQFQGHSAAADDLFAIALDTADRSDYEYGRGLAKLGLASSRRSLGRLDDSLRLGRQALDIARRWQLRKIICESLNVIGETTVALENLPHAEDVFGRAREYSDKYGFSHYVARALEGLAHVRWLTDRFDDARAYWEQAVQLYPTGMYEARYARMHLDAVDDRSVVCLRCEMVRAESCPPSALFADEAIHFQVPWS